MSPALIDGSELAAKAAVLPAEQRDRYLQWQGQEGGLIFFLNAAAIWLGEQIQEQWQKIQQQSLLC